jgi:hypothetical protein
MGVGATKDKNIDLYIELNKQYYYPGDVIEGEAYVNVNNNTNTNGKVE